MTLELPRSRGPLPPVYFLGAILLEWAVHKWLPLVHWITWPWRWGGMLFVVAGVTLALVANRRFSTMGTTVKPFQPSTALATDGAYRFTRNPMYTGMILVLSGEAVLLGCLGPWLIIPPYMFLITELFIKKEEAGLALQFGGKYDEYRRSVRRWL
jgi:protein-S-isoprenylcysteine O-methyltransferase Ste14